MNEPPSATGELAALVESHWQDKLAIDPLLCISSGRPARRLPGGMERDAQTLAVSATPLLARADRIDRGALTDSDKVTLAMLRWSLLDATRQPFLCRYAFALAGYASPLTHLSLLLSSAPLADAGDADAYLALVSEVPALLEDIAEHTRIQAAHGIRAPLRALDQAKSCLTNLRVAPGAGCLPEAARLAALPTFAAQRLEEALFELAHSRIGPGLDALLHMVEHELRPCAPAAVGLGQYPGGDAAYAMLIDRYVSLDGIDPGRIHQLGLDALADCEARMAAQREAFGFGGDARAFRQHLLNLPGVTTPTAEAMGAKLARFGSLLDSRVDRLFSKRPRTAARVERLDPALESFMTFGYYDLPTANRPYGVYYYNAAAPAQTFSADYAGLMAHEITPGHHFQAMLALESPTLTELQKYMAHDGYLEGWAEYASHLLADEMGAYADTIDRYGRLTMDQAMAVRLVLDTGLNALGWDFERAARFMHDHGSETPDQIESELLRYGVGIPAQALAYRLGMDHFIALRRDSERRLGARFDVRRFHDALVEHGSVPLDALGEHMDGWAARELGR